MMEIFNKPTGTKIKVVVEYEVEYDTNVHKFDVADILDFGDVIQPSNIVAIREIKVKAIRN